MTDWRRAREVAEQVGQDAPTRVLNVPVARAAGLTLAADVHCRQALPRFDNSAMDGWALAGDGPWRVGEAVLAGSVPPSMPLRSGEARPIATGAPIPPGTHTVLRTEDAIRYPCSGDRVLEARATPTPGRDIRREGEEAEPGDILLRAGAVLSPPAVGLLVAAGVADVDVSTPPLVTFIAIGDELAGADPGPGGVTDSLSPMMPSLLAALGGRCTSTAHASDRAANVVAAISRARTETIVTSGGTAHGPADPLRDALDRLSARILIDGMDLRPGGSMLLATLPDGRHVLSLPGNPLAAVVALTVVGWPLLQGRIGRKGSGPKPCTAAEREGLGGLIATGGPARAVACVLAGGTFIPAKHQRSGMLRGITGATHLALVHETDAHLLHLPWAFA